MKKIVSVLLALLFILSLCPTVFAEESAKDPIYDLALDSQGVYIFNTETGTPIYEKAENSRMFPASTTKIMTALITLELCPDPKNTVVTVPDSGVFSYIIEDGGMNGALVKGEELTVYDLLMGLMINSYCDVAEVLGYHFGGGDVAAFVAKMNEKAAALGMTNTNFENTHGLHEPNHYSSPKDIAILLAESIKNPTFREILETKNYTIPKTNRSAARKLKHTVNIFSETNDYYLDAFVGGKSGFTDQAGRCLAAVSEKDGISFVSVLLGANMDTNRKYGENMAFVETHTLISYAYENFELKTVLEKGTHIADIPVLDSEISLPVIAGESIVLLSRKDKETDYRTELPASVSAEDVEDGKVIGSIRLLFNEEESDASYPLLLSWDGVPIVTKSQIQKGAENAVDSVTGIFKTDKIFLTLLILLIAMVALCIPAIKITDFLHRKKARKPKH